jgi:hypothetical protein
MSNEHTPGPWYWKAGNLEAAQNEVIIYPANVAGDLPDDAPMACQMGSYGEMAEEDADANARLIAAAPDLLTACQMRAMLDDWAMSEDDDKKTDRMKADLLRRCSELGWKADPSGQIDAIIDIIPFIDNLARTALAKAKGTP